MRHPVLTVLLLGLIDFVKSNPKYVERDFAVVRHLREHLNSKNFIFIGHTNDLCLIKEVKSLTKKNLFSSIISASLLEDIFLNNETPLNFFQIKTLIISKEKLNLNILLQKVSVPYLLTWVLFLEYAVYKDLYIPLSSDVLFVQSTLDKTTINQVYDIKPRFGKLIKTVWNWPLRTQSDSKPVISFDLKKNDFQNVSLNMSVLHNKKFCEKLNGLSIINKVECLHRNLIKMIGSRLNFRINPMECMDKENPYIYPNGSESELFLKLRNRKVDFSVASHLIRKERIGSFDFIWPTFILKSMMYLKQSKLTGHWKSYLRPMHSSMWQGILYLIIGTAIILHIFEKLLATKFKFKQSFLIDFIVSIFTSLQIFCNQGVSDIAQSYSIRIIFLLELFAVLVFYNSYCGYLVSSLTVAIPYFPFTNLKGFFDNKQYKIITVSEGFHKFFFSKVITGGKNLMLLNSLPENVQAAVDKLCQEEWLVLVEFREALLNIDKFKCKILRLPHPVVYIYMAIILPRNSPYKEIINREKLHLESTGIMQRMRTHLSSHDDFYDKKSEEEFVSVAMSQVFSIFIMLGIGILLSLLTLIFEICAKKQKSSINKKPRMRLNNLLLRMH